MMKLALVVAVAWLGSQEDRKSETVVEVSKDMKGGGGLGTAIYPETDREASFLKKVDEKPIALWARTKVPKPSNMSEEEWAKIRKKAEKATEGRTPVDKYELAGQEGRYVGWFGIVREVKRQPGGRVATLLLEHKYFDGMVDLHQQIVSLYGAGDFAATVAADVKSIPLLGLVRVYGKVRKNKEGGAVLKADYVRVWKWGQFAFMDYGMDKTNPKWLKLRADKEADVYSARPGEKYYETWLGKKP